MTTVDLNKPVLGLDKTEVKVQNNVLTLGRIFSEQLVGCSAKDEETIDFLVKAAETFNQSKPLKASEKELGILKNVVLECQLTVIAKKQLLAALKNESLD